MARKRCGKGDVWSPVLKKCIPDTKKSRMKARAYLIEKGICAIDGSGNPDVEALFVDVAQHR
jgi:hypothetical protein